MAITAALTITQGTDNSTITLTDATNYSGGELVGDMTARSVTIYKSDGTTLGTYAFSGSSLTKEVTGLTKDLAIKAVLTLTPAVVVGGSTYTKNVWQAITGYSMTGFYQRHNKMALDTRLERNRDYVTDNYKIQMEVQAAQQACVAEDIVSAQYCLDRVKNILDRNPLPY